MRWLLLVCMLLTPALPALSAVSAEVVYTPQDSAKIVRIIHEACGRDILEDTILYIARKFKGFPYVAKTLDKGSEERLVVNVRGLDCTTFVENTLAVYLCCKTGRDSFEDFCQFLRDIRYGAREVSYTNRLHYFSQWIEANASSGVVEETQRPDSVFTRTQTLDINYMSRHPSLYPMLAAHPQLVSAISETEKRLSGKQYKYIPKGETANSARLRSVVRNGDILAIVTDKAGLDISHIGFAVWHDDGLHLMHASMTLKKVVEDPLTLHDYMARHASQKGIRVIHVRR